MGWETWEPEKFWNVCYRKARRVGWSDDEAKDFAQEAYIIAYHLKWNSTLSQMYLHWKRQHLGSSTSRKRAHTYALRNQDAAEPAPSYEIPEWKLSAMSILEKMLFALFKEGFTEEDLKETFFKNRPAEWEKIREAFWDRIFLQAESEGVPVAKLTSVDARGRVRTPKAYNTSKKRRELEQVERERVARNRRLKQTLSEAKKDPLDLFREGEASSATPDV